MQDRPVIMAEDKSLAIPPGKIVKTDNVPVWKVRLACKDRMSVGDVKGAYEKLLQNQPNQLWPCPRGHWEDDIFVIVDGRHQFIATLMFGYETILVAWVE